MASSAFAGDLKFNSVSLDVKSVAARKNVRDDYKTDWGSYDKNYDRERNIEIAIRTSGKEPLAVVVKSWWLGKPIANSQRVLIAKTESKVTLSNDFQKLTSSSGNVEGRDLRLRAIGQRHVEGYKIDGWVVTVHDPENDAVVAVKLSDGHLQSLVGADFQLKQLKTIGKEN